MHFMFNLLFFHLHGIVQDSHIIICMNKERNKFKNFHLFLSRDNIKKMIIQSRLSTEYIYSVLVCEQSRADVFHIFLNLCIWFLIHL